MTDQLTQALMAAARLLQRGNDGLEIFRPTSYQEPVILAKATEHLVQGGTRSGKSTIVAALIAAYARNRPITFSDGSKHNIREKAWANRPVVVWLVGLQLSHIGQTLYRLLRQPGAYDCVQDPVTGKLRAWQPGVVPGDDKIGPDGRVPAPPLIPDEEVINETWENKAEHKLTSMTLRNGSMIYAFASTAKVKRGDPVNILWIDEEIQFSEYYSEWQSRLSDRKGRLYWTSWPDLKTPALLRLCDRAKTQAREVARGERKTADVVRFTFVGSNSPFVDKDEIRKRSEGWSEAERLARDFGEFPTEGILAYPEFSEDLHVVDYGDNDDMNDRVTDVMRRLNGTVPDDWSVDLILDPGTTSPAVLWCAIPTPDYWDCGMPYYIVYREMNIPRIDARDMALRIRAIEPTRTYARFIIDKKAGAQTPMGFAHRVAYQYSQEFRAVGVRNVATGFEFMPSEHVWAVRTLKLRAWMRGRVDCPRPQLRIYARSCPKLIDQLKSIRKMLRRDEVQDKIAEGQVHDVLDTLEYWAGSDPTFRVVSPESRNSPGLRMFEQEGIFWQNLSGNNSPAKQMIMLGAPGAV